MNNSICVLGSINIDLSIKSPKEMKIGETIHGSGFIIGHGGKGANQALAMAKLGGQAYILGNVGNDIFGRELIESLKMNGVNTEYSKIVELIPTGTAVIIVIDGNNSIILDAGANDNVTVDYVHMSEKIISECSMLVSQFEIPYTSVNEAFRMAKKNGVITLLNPSPSKNIGDELYRNTDIIIANELEASDLTGINVYDINSAKDAIKWFINKGIKTSVITLGAQGCVFFDGLNIEHNAVRKVDVVDSTCAGDSFLGAFAVSLINGKCIKYAIEYASAASAITVTRRGAQSSLPDASEVEVVMDIIAI